MRQSRFTEAQIIGMIKEQEAGMPTAEVCRRHACALRRSTSSKQNMVALTFSTPIALSRWRMRTPS